MGLRLFHNERHIHVYIRVRAISDPKWALISVLSVLMTQWFQYYGKPSKRRIRLRHHRTVQVKIELNRKYSKCSA